MILSIFFAVTVFVISALSTSAWHRGNLLHNNRRKSCVVEHVKMSPDDSLDATKSDGIVAPRQVTTKMGNGKARKVKRYDIVPMTLYRLQPKLPVRLRNYDDQVALGRSSFDLKVHEGDGLVYPAEGDEFIGPNGMSLRPRSEFMTKLVETFKGDPTVYTLIPGLELPESLILLHEHTDHFSLQVRNPMSLDAFNDELTAFLKTLPTQTKEQYVAAMNDEDDFDN